MAACAPARLMELYGFMGLERERIDDAAAGDIVAFSGLENLRISDTLCDKNQPEGAAARCRWTSPPSA